MNQVVLRTEKMKSHIVKLQISIEVSKVTDFKYNQIITENNVNFY